MTNASAAAPARGALDEGLFNKVPEVTACFWIIKVLATTVGETAADLLSMRLGLGLGVTSAVMAAVFVVGLVVQLRCARYVPSRRAELRLAASATCRRSAPSRLTCWPS